MFFPKMTADKAKPRPLIQDAEHHPRARTEAALRGNLNRSREANLPSSGETRYFG